ncbi:general secretion pathway protein GspK [Gallaecimonas xiamenensis]|uniref:Type II secretion system protein K n=1 Tax=Gallaecimonas xiamenensis 3-C-1 TaxID=745411 RepID=K2JNA5_9GAMM|nr:type II secretion system protein GspK [Gallaecimonas xiamenensis]EKE75972.1 general secretion pathway protein K [Gallaecimonas xiamenensis 3-C-1]
MALKVPAKGVALVAVLWLLALLSLMAAALTTTSRLEGQLTLNQDQTVRGQALAEGAIRLAMVNLLQPATQQPWLADGGIQQISLNQQQVELAISDERGKVDINNATPELLTQLLLAAGADEQEVQLVDVILDWRDGDDLVSLHGAEDADYAAAGLDYGAKDAPFQSLDELDLLLGMPAALAQRLKPALTVMTHASTVNPLYAPPLVLLALAGGDQTLVDNYVQERRRSHQQHVTPPVFPLDSPLLAKGSSTGLYYSISAQSWVDDQRPYAMTVLVKRQGRFPDMPFDILSQGRTPPWPGGGS